MRLNVIRKEEKKNVKCNRVTKIDWKEISSVYNDTTDIS